MLRLGRPQTSTIRILTSTQRFITSGSVQFALHAQHYYDKAWYERDRKNIFAKEWVYVGTKHDVTQPGQYLSATIAGWPIFVIKDRENNMRAFHNVCRHRAGPVVWSDNPDEDARGHHKGRCEVLRCKYHGWLYDTNGNLKKALNFGADLNNSEYNLRGIRVEEWKGLLFINMDENAIPLQQTMEPISNHLSDFPIETYDVHEEVSHDLHCNWKTYVDNYQEGYHISSVHPELNSQVKTKDYNVIVHEDEKFCLHEVAPRNDSNTKGVWLWKYPNLMINAYDNGLSIESAMPVGPQLTQLQYAYMFKKDVDPNEKATALRGSELLTVEDKRIVEAVQRNLQAGIYERGPLSPRYENGVAAFHRWYEQSHKQDN
jgi:choline monooxygenase